MANRATRWGGLQTQVLEPNASDEIIGNVVLCHGFGAPGTDLVPLTPLLFQFEPSLQQRVRFIYPAAPLDLADLGIPGGRAWWNIDIMKLQETIAAGRGRELLDQSPSALPAVREQFLEFLRECVAETGIPLKRTLIGGFSQGSMLTTDAALHLPEPPAGLIILSGMLMNQSVWQKQLQHRSGLPVFQSHGRFDPLLPFNFALALRDLLQNSGNPVEFCEFAGAHEIPYQVLQQVASFVQRCLASPLT